LLFYKLLLQKAISTDLSATQMNIDSNPYYTHFGKHHKSKVKFSVELCINLALLNKMSNLQKIP